MNNMKTFYVFEDKKKPEWLSSFSSVCIQSLFIEEWVGPALESKVQITVF